MMDEELLDMMRQEEDAALAASGVTATQPPTSLNLPISSGRMYMGPALKPGAEEAFLQMPSGTSWNLAPPPTAPAPTELERLQAADLPGSRTISIRRDVPMPMPEDPRMARFAMLEEYQRLRAAGVPETEAVSRIGLNYFGTQMKPITPYQQENLAMQRRRLDLAEASQEAKTAPVETVTEIVPDEPGLPTIPATPGEKRSLFGIDFLRRDIPPTPEIPGTPGKPAQRITRKITAPSGTEKVRVKSPDGKIGFVPSSQLRAALAQGYTQVR